MAGQKNDTFAPAMLRLGAVAVSVVSTLAVALGCAGDGHENPLGERRPGAVMLPPPKRLFGFNDQTFLFTGGKEPNLDQGVTAERELADLHAAGANSARVLVGWWDLEPEPGKLDFAYIARLKAFTDALERSNGRVLLVLGVPPPWASASPGDPRATIADTPQSLRAFARYAGIVARTWPQAAGIETWNEPNTTYFWRPGTPEPERYARMHRAGAAAVRRASARTPVLLGGLLGAVGVPAIMPPREFLERAFAAGLRPRDYDALAYHGYPPQAGGRAGPVLEGPFADSLANFREGYRHQDPSARLWITEAGVTTTGAVEAVKPAEQASVLIEIVRELLSLRDVDALFVHSLYEQRLYPPSSPHRGYGLLVARGAESPTPKPAFCALRKLARDLPPLPGCPP